MKPRLGRSNCSSRCLWSKKTETGAGRVCERVRYVPHPSRAPAAHWERVSPSLRRIELDAKIPVLGLNQESRVLLAFGLAAWGFAASAFTRPVSATTWGAAVIGSHPGSP
jgi:hypothetical protein